MPYPRPSHVRPLIFLSYLPSSHQHKTTRQPDNHDWWNPPWQTIQLVIPHLLTDSQFEMLKDLTFMHFEGTLGTIPFPLSFLCRYSWETTEAWPISLKIITELYESIPLPAPHPHSHPHPHSIHTPYAPPSEDELPTEEEQQQGREEKKKSETTRISVSTSKEWDPASEEAVRRIVRNVLIEIMGGGWVLI